MTDINIQDGHVTAILLVNGWNPIVPGSYQQGEVDIEVNNQTVKLTFMTGDCADSQESLYIFSEHCMGLKFINPDTPQRVIATIMSDEEQRLLP